jgi:hypothetical protein
MATNYLPTDLMLSIVSAPDRAKSEGTNRTTVENACIEMDYDRNGMSYR